MSPTDILREAETDLASLAGLPGEIRARVKAGVAELTRLRDAIDATIASLTGSAQTTLASLQAMAATESQASEPAPPAGPAVQPTTAPAASEAGTAVAGSFGG